MGKWYFIPEFEDGQNAYAYSENAVSTKEDALQNADIIIVGLNGDDTYVKSLDELLEVKDNTLTLSDDEYGALTMVSGETFKNFTVYHKDNYTVVLDESIPTGTYKGGDNDPNNDIWKLKNGTATYTHTVKEVATPGYFGTDSTSENFNVINYVYYDSGTTGEKPYSVEISGFSTYDNETERQEAEEELQNAFTDVKITVIEDNETVTVALTDDALTFVEDNATKANKAITLTAKVNGEDAVPKFSLNNLKTSDISVTATKDEYKLTKLTDTNIVQYVTAGVTKGWLLDASNAAISKVTGNDVTSKPYVTITGVSDSATDGEWSSSSGTISIDIPNKFGTGPLGISVNSEATTNNVIFNLSSLSAGYTVQLNSGQIGLSLAEAKSGTIEFNDNSITKDATSNLLKPITISGASTVSDGTTFYFNTDEEIEVNIDEFSAKDKIILKSATTTRSLEGQIITLGNVKITATTVPNNTLTSQIKVYEGDTLQGNLADYLAALSPEQWEEGSGDDTGKVFLTKGSVTYVAIKGVDEASQLKVPTKTGEGDAAYYPVDLKNQISAGTLEITAGNDSSRTFQFTTSTEGATVDINRSKVYVIDEHETGVQTFNVAADVSNVTIDSGGGADVINMNNNEITLIAEGGIEDEINFGDCYIDFTDETIWDSTTHTLTFKLKNKKTDDSGESTITDAGTKKIILPDAYKGKTLNEIIAADSLGGLSFNAKDIDNENSGQITKSLRGMFYTAPPFEWKDLTEIDATNHLYSADLYILRNGDVDTTKAATIKNLPGTVNGGEAITEAYLNNLNLVEKNEDSGWKITLPKTLISHLETNINLKITVTKDSTFFNDVGVDNPYAGKSFVLATSDEVQEYNATGNGGWRYIGTSKTAEFDSPGELAGYQATPGESPTLEYKAVTGDNTGQRLLAISGINSNINTSGTNWGEALAVTANYKTTKTFTSENTDIFSKDAETAAPKIYVADEYKFSFNGDAVKFAVSSEINNATIIGSIYEDDITVDFSGRDKTTPITSLQIQGGNTEGDETAGDVINISNIVGGDKVKVYGGDETGGFDTENDTFNIGNNATGLEIFSGEGDTDTFNFNGTGASVTLHISANDKISIGGAGVDIKSIKLNANGTISLGDNTVTVKYGGQTISTKDDLLNTEDLKDIKIFNGASDADGRTLTQIEEDNKVMSLTKGKWKITTEKLQYVSNDESTVYFTLNGLTLGDKTEGTAIADTDVSVVFDTNSTTAQVHIDNTLLGTTNGTEVTITYGEDSDYKSANTTLALMEDDSDLLQSTVTEAWATSTSELDATKVEITYQGPGTKGYYTVSPQKITVSDPTAKGFTISGNLAANITVKAGDTIDGVSFNSSEGKITIGSPVLGTNTSTMTTVEKTEGFADGSYTFVLDTTSANKVNEFKEDGEDKWVITPANEKTNATYKLDFIDAGYKLDNSTTISYHQAQDESGSTAITFQNLPGTVTEDNISTAITVNTGTKVAILNSAALSQDNTITVTEGNLEYTIAFGTGVDVATYTPQGFSSKDETTAIYTTKEGFSGSGYYHNTSNADSSTIAYHTSTSDDSAKAVLEISGLTITGGNKAARDAALRDGANGLQITNSTVTIPDAFISNEATTTTPEENPQNANGNPDTTTPTAANLEISTEDTSNTDAYTIDLSANTNLVNVTVTRANTNINTGANADTVSMTGIANTVGTTISTGTGSDNITVSNSEKVSIDAGTGDADVINISGGKDITVKANANNKIVLSGSIDGLTITDLTADNADEFTISVADTDLSTTKPTFIEGKLKLGEQEITLSNITNKDTIKDLQIIYKNVAAEPVALSTLLECWQLKDGNDGTKYAAYVNESNQEVIKITGNFTANDIDLSEIFSAPKEATGTSLPEDEQGSSTPQSDSDTEPESDKKACTIKVISVEKLLGEEYSIELTDDGKLIYSNIAFTGTDSVLTGTKTEASWKVETPEIPSQEGYKNVDGTQEEQSTGSTKNVTYTSESAIAGWMVNETDAKKLTNVKAMTAYSFTISGLNCVKEDDSESLTSVEGITLVAATTADAEPPADGSESSGKDGATENTATPKQYSGVTLTKAVIGIEANTTVTISEGYTLAFATGENPTASTEVKTWVATPVAGTTNPESGSTGTSDPVVDNSVAKTTLTYNGGGHDVGYVITDKDGNSVGVNAAGTTIQYYKDAIDGSTEIFEITGLKDGLTIDPASKNTLQPVTSITLAGGVITVGKDALTSTDATITTTKKYKEDDATEGEGTDYVFKLDTNVTAPSPTSQDNVLALGADMPNDDTSSATPDNDGVEEGATVTKTTVTYTAPGTTEGWSIAPAAADNGGSSASGTPEETTEAEVTVTGTTITYTPAVPGKLIFTIKGLDKSKVTNDSTTLNEGVVTVGPAGEGKIGYTITLAKETFAATKADVTLEFTDDYIGEKGNYNFVISDADYEPSEKDNYFQLAEPDGTTSETPSGGSDPESNPEGDTSTPKVVSYMSGGMTEGYTITLASATGASAIVHHDEVPASTLFTIEGIDTSTLAPKDGSKINELAGNQITYEESSNTVTIDGSLFDGTNDVKATATSGNAEVYNVAVSGTYTQPTTIDDYWTKPSDKVQLIHDAKTAGYTKVDAVPDEGSKAGAYYKANAKEDGTATHELSGIVVTTFTNVADANDDGVTPLKPDATKIEFSPDGKTITIKDATLLDSTTKADAMVIALQTTPSDDQSTGTGSNADDGTATTPQAAAKGYTVKLDDTLVDSKRPTLLGNNGNYLSLVEGTVTYFKDAQSDGYTNIQAGDEVGGYIDYIENNTGTKLFTITGLKTTGVDGFENAEASQGIYQLKTGFVTEGTESGKTTFTINKELLNGTNVTLDWTGSTATDNEKANYSLKLDSDAVTDQNNTWAAHFKWENGAAVFHIAGTKEYYTEDSETGGITHHDADEGAAQFKITGLDTNKFTEDTGADLDSNIISYDATTNTITIAQAYLSTEAGALVTIESATTTETDFSGYHFAIKPTDEGNPVFTVSNQGYTVSDQGWTKEDSATEPTYKYTEKWSGPEIIEGNDEDQTAPRIKYHNPDTPQEFATISNVTISNEGLTALKTATNTETGVITFTDEILGNFSNPDESSKGNYTFTVSGYTAAFDGVTRVTTQNEKWTISTEQGASTGKVTYTEPTETAGWGLNNTTDEDGTSTQTITRYVAKESQEIEISGLISNVKLNAKKHVTGISIIESTDYKPEFEGLSDFTGDANTKVVKIAKNLLSTDTDIKVTIKQNGTDEESTNEESTSTSYNYVIDTDAVMAKDREAPYWTAENEGGHQISYRGTAKGGTTVKTHGYEFKTDGVYTELTYNKEEGDAIFVVDGVKSDLTSKIKTSENDSDSLIGITQSLVEGGESFTFASNVVGSKGITIKGSDVDGVEPNNEYKYAFTLSGKGKMVYSLAANATLGGSNGNDTIVNDSGKQVTIEGGRGADQIKAGSAGDFIYSGGGNDSIVLGAGSDTVSYDGGKVTIDGFTVDDSLEPITGYEVSKSSLSATGLVLQLGNTSNTLTFKGATANDSITVGDSIFAGDYVYTKNEDEETVMAVNAGFGKSSVTVADNIQIFDGSDGKKALTITANNLGDTITGTSKADKINGGTGADNIDGGNGNDTINGDAGNNILTGGDGKDIFIVGTGTDVITDYTGGVDKISLGSGISVVDVATVEGDDGESGLELTLSNKNTVTINSTDKDTKLTINNVANYYGDHAFYSSNKKAVTLSSNFKDEEFDISEDNTLVTIDASNVTTEIAITGNAKNNSISAGSQGSTLDGGNGNDTLVGGAGADVFVYDGKGKDVIVNYSSNDTISLEGGFEDITGATVKSGTSGNTVTFKVGSQTLTVKDAQTDVFTFGEDTYTIGTNYYIDNENKVSMWSGFKGTFDTSSITGVAAKITEIDGSESKNSMKIIANGKDNTISGGTKADTLSGGAGNDELTGGAGNDSLNGGAGNDKLTGGAGRDIFAYTIGEGDDTITDYQAGQDKIRILGGSIDSVSYGNNNEIIFHMGKNTLTILDEEGEGMNITTIIDGKTRTSKYAKPVDETSTKANVYDLLYDNNFTTDEFGIDDISEVKADNYSVGDVKTDTNANLVPDQNAITYGEDENK